MIANDASKGLTAIPLSDGNIKRVVVLDCAQFRAHLARFADACGSQKALARQLKVSQQHISDVISGRRQPGRRFLSLLGAKRKTVIEIEVESE